MYRFVWLALLEILVKAMTQKCDVFVLYFLIVFAWHVSLKKFCWPVERDGLNYAPMIGFNTQPLTPVYIWYKKQNILDRFINCFFLQINKIDGGKIYGKLLNNA